MAEVLAGSRSESTAPATTPSGSQVTAYFDRLVARLRAVHEKPSDLGDGLKATVEFVLRADGTVSGVRILESSGSEAFDVSVLNAFGRLAALGEPPSGAAGMNQVVFRTRGE